MGSTLSTPGICCASVKSSRGNSKRNLRASSRNGVDHPRPSEQQKTEDRRAVVLTKEDFEEGHMEQLVKRSPRIEHVEFEENEKQWILIDSDLEKLQRLPHLTSIDLSGCCEITRRALEFFTLKPGQITSLILRDCPKITDTFFPQIVHFSHLERLSVRGCFRISDKGVEDLLGLKMLRCLDLSVRATEDPTTQCSFTGCPTITDTSMHILAQMKQLEELQIERCLAVSDSGIIRLVTLRNLTLLNLAGTGLTNEGLKILRHLPELCDLNVADCDLTESSAVELSEAKKLKHLRISNIPGVTDNFIAGIAEHLDLEQLNIAGCEQVSDKCLTHISKFTSLTHLNANNCPGITGNTLVHLSTLTKLRCLHLNEAVNISHADILAIGTLEQLEIGAHSANAQQLSLLTRLEHLADLTVHVSSEEPALCTTISGIRVQLVKHTIHD